MAGATTLIESNLKGDQRPLVPELAKLIAWETEQRQRDHRRAELLATVNLAGLTAEHGHTTAAWFADACQLSDNSARATVKLAMRLHESYPVLAAALHDGRVGWQHVTVFDRAANARNRAAMTALLPELLDLADVATFERWSQELRGIAERLDQDGGYDPSRDNHNNELHLTPTIDGFTHISGKLVGEVALVVRSLINAEADRIMARHRADAEAIGTDVHLPSHATTRAEALVELLERGAGTPDGHGRMPEPEIVVTFDVDSQELTDDTGELLSLTVLRWILAAGLMRSLEITEHKDALRMGHTLRYANRDQRRALAIRDGGCIFPGCTRPPAWCDAHHVDHWDHDHPEHGGPTDIENLGLLCRHHHRVTHRPGWQMERWHDHDHPDAVVFRWRTPAGRVIYSQRHGIRWKLPDQLAG